MQVQAKVMAHADCLCFKYTGKKGEARLVFAPKDKDFLRALYGERKVGRLIKLAAYETADFTFNSEHLESAVYTTLFKDVPSDSVTRSVTESSFLPNHVGLMAWTDTIVVTMFVQKAYPYNPDGSIPFPRQLERAFTSVTNLMQEAIYTTEVASFYDSAALRLAINVEGGSMSQTSGSETPKAPRLARVMGHKEHLCFKFSLQHGHDTYVFVPRQEEIVAKFFGLNGGDVASLVKGLPAGTVGPASVRVSIPDTLESLVPAGDDLSGPSNGLDNLSGFDGISVLHMSCKRASIFVLVKKDDVDLSQTAKEPSLFDKHFPRTLQEELMSIAIGILEPEEFAAAWRVRGAFYRRGFFLLLSTPANLWQVNYKKEVAALDEATASMIQASSGWTEAFRPRPASDNADFRDIGALGYRPQAATGSDKVSPYTLDDTRTAARVPSVERENRPQVDPLPASEETGKPAMTIGGLKVQCPKPRPIIDVNKFIENNTRARAGRQMPIRAFGESEISDRSATVSGARPTGNVQVCVNGATISVPAHFETMAAYLLQNGASHDGVLTTISQFQKDAAEKCGPQASVEELIAYETRLANRMIDKTKEHLKNDTEDSSQPRDAQSPAEPTTTAVNDRLQRLATQLSASGMSRDDVTEVMEDIDRVVESLIYASGQKSVSSELAWFHVLSSVEFVSDKFSKVIEGLVSNISSNDVKLDQSYLSGMSFDWKELPNRADLEMVTMPAGQAMQEHGNNALIATLRVGRVVGRLGAVFHFPISVIDDLIETCDRVCMAYGYMSVGAASAAYRKVEEFLIGKLKTAMAKDPLCTEGVIRGMVKRYGDDLCARVVTMRTLDEALVDLVRAERFASLVQAMRKIDLSNEEINEAMDYLDREVARICDYHNSKPNVVCKWTVSDVEASLIARLAGDVVELDIASLSGIITMAGRYIEVLSGSDALSTEQLPSALQGCFEWIMSSR